VAEIAALERNVARFKPSTFEYVVSGLEPHLRPAFKSMPKATEQAQDVAGARRKTNIA
jgi:hypothetical protein